MLVSEILGIGTGSPTVIVHSDNAKGHRRVLRNGYGGLMTVESLTSSVVSYSAIRWVAPTCENDQSKSGVLV
jgi:hypothetical protein